MLSASEPPESFTLAPLHRWGNQKRRLSFLENEEIGRSILRSRRVQGVPQAVLEFWDSHALSLRLRSSASASHPRRNSSVGTLDR